MAVTEVFTGVAAADYDSALTWYERLMGRPPDVLPKEHEAGWELSEAGWIYLVDDADRAGKAMLTLVVDDLERLVGNVAERGYRTRRDRHAPGRRANGAAHRSGGQHADPRRGSRPGRDRARPRPRSAATGARPAGSSARRR